jgi:hypothetical protein
MDWKSLKRGFYPLVIQRWAVICCVLNKVCDQG